MDRAQVEAEPTPEVVGVPLGLGEQVAGVEQRDVDAGHHRVGEVSEHRIAEARRHDQVVTERLTGPAQDLVGGRVLVHALIQSNVDYSDQV